MGEKKYELEIQKTKLKREVVMLSSAIIGLTSLIVGGLVSYYAIRSEDSTTESPTLVAEHKVDTLFISEQIPTYIEPTKGLSDEQRIDGRISELITTFDENQTDFINTRIRVSSLDTLSDGSTRFRKTPLLSTKTSEQAYLEMKSSHAQLIAYLESKDKVQNYKVVIENQRREIEHAFHTFRSNMGSPLFGLEDVIALD